MLWAASRDRRRPIRHGVLQFGAGAMSERSRPSGASTGARRGGSVGGRIVKRVVRLDVVILAGALAALSASAAAASTPRLYVVAGALAGSPGGNVTPGGAATVGGTLWDPPEGIAALPDGSFVLSAYGDIGGFTDEHQVWR